MPDHSISVDPEVWECLVNRQALLTVKYGRRVSISDTVRDLLAATAPDGPEAGAEEAQPQPREGGDA